ncbi:hypothetical protein ACJJI4_07205 [Microbulbifer sp. TRSA002]|uniref:hypothetical protein n=1 Tax=Microbulbifer sp. TRSA002 TaxID=3243382 RepID=UPI00403A42DF
MKLDNRFNYRAYLAGRSSTPSRPAPQKASIENVSDNPTEAPQGVKAFTTQEIIELQRLGGDLQKQKETMISIILTREFSHRVPSEVLQEMIHSAFNKAGENEAYQYKLEKLIFEITQ